MTAAAALREPGPDGGAVAARLAALTDPVFLTGAGWDPVTRVLSLPSAHPLLGWRACPSPGCGNLLYGRDRECGSCRRGTTARRLASPGAAALAAQPCGVAACPRGRGRRRYCRAHWERFLDLRGDASFDEEAWQETEPAIEEPGQVSLHGLTGRAAAEVLFGLQQRTRCGTTTDSVRLRQVAWELRRTGAAAISQITGGEQTQHRLARSLARHAGRAMLAPEAEARKDVWDLAAFGLPGRLDFTRLRQGWLRESARRWAADNLPRRRGKIAAGPVRHYLTSLAMLSGSLHASRDDHGADPAALGRPDIESFAHRMAFLAATEKISGDARTRACREVRHLLREFRALGLTRPGGPAGGLPDDFAVRGSDIPLKPDDPEAGRDLPPEVMRQLCDRLPDLERASCRETRAAAELIIDTGRRPDEICALPWDCLEYDEPGREPVLVYSNHKSARDGRRLPVARATADLVLAQKARVREMFPGTPLGELRLLPAAYANPHGRRPVTENHFGACHREWVDAMPPLLRADGTEFDKARVVPYAYRHTYAQRHADAGVPVDKVASLQFDRRGNRVWRDAKTLLDSEAARRAIGEVAVPYGTCSEPSNVQAGGNGCPYRFRCAGCGHFRTDVSYLPDLRAYLDDLLRNRERVLAAADIDQWARAEAVPSSEEIATVRSLIARVEAGLEHLTADEREQTDQAVAIVRRHRTVTLGMPRMRQALPDIRPGRTA